MSLTDAQLRAELERCQSCEARPCRAGCPADLSPAEFILAARTGDRSGYRRAAAHILTRNPLGGVCGAVCPDTLCMARCTRRTFDGPVNIPAVQEAIVRRARALGVLPRLAPLPPTGQRVAVVGAGPAGLGAASVLARAGHAVDLLDLARAPGGMARLIPLHRLDPAVLAADLDWLLGQGGVRLVLGKPVALPRDLLARGYAAVVVAGGQGEPVRLDVPGQERALGWTQVLGPRPPRLRGRRVAVVGDGPVAVDCARAALGQGAAHVELFALRSLSELALTRRERDRFLESGIHLSGRVRVSAIRGRGDRVTGLALRKVELPAGQAFHPARLRDLPHGAHERRDLDAVVFALGGRGALRLEPHPRIVYAGDLESGPTSVVEALASGNRAALAVHRLLAGDDAAACPDRATCAGGSGCPKRETCPEWNPPTGSGRTAVGARTVPGLPVPLDTDFLGRPLPSPFLLSAAPFTRGYAPLRRAYEAGWAGALATFAPGDDLDRLCADVERLRQEFPDRLTIVTPGGPAPDAADTDAWAGAARRLEAAGAAATQAGALASTDGPMDHLGAAALLARGARTVPCSAVVLRHGLGIVGELQVGLSHHLAERGLRSISELREATRPAAAPPMPVVSGVDRALCTGCGNCTRCPSTAIALDPRGIAAVDAARCTGCGLCVGQCLVGAVALRPAA